jgi:hypothetical protein
MRHTAKDEERANLQQNCQSEIDFFCGSVDSDNSNSDSSDATRNNLKNVYEVLRGLKQNQG